MYIYFLQFHKREAYGLPQGMQQFTIPFKIIFLCNHNSYSVNGQNCQISHVTISGEAALPQQPIAAPVDGDGGFVGENITRRNTVIPRPTGRQPVHLSRKKFNPNNSQG